MTEKSENPGRYRKEEGRSSRSEGKEGSRKDEGRYSRPKREGSSGKEEGRFPRSKGREGFRSGSGKSSDSADKRRGPRENSWKTSDDRKKPFSEDKPKARTTPTGNVVKVWREGFTDERPEPEDKWEKKTPTPPIAKKPVSGRKLWVKGKNHSKAGDAPPAGHDKHKDLTSYCVEEQERLHEERAKKRYERKLKEAANPRPRKPSIDIPVSASEVLPAEPGIATVEPVVERLYTVGFAGLSIQKLLRRLVDAEIKIALDVRSENSMLMPGFSKSRDLAILFKEAAGIEYRREDMLIPKSNILTPYIIDKNWVRFSMSYRDHLDKMRIDATLNRLMFSASVVALLGEQADAEKDHRSIIAGYLKDAWDITAVINL